MSSEVKKKLFKEQHQERESEGAGCVEALIFVAVFVFLVLLGMIADNLKDIEAAIRDSAQIRNQTQSKHLGVNSGRNYFNF